MFKLQLSINFTLIFIEKSFIMKTRNAAFAGKFYPDTKEEIVSQLDTILKSEKSKINYDLSEKEIIGGVVPHAGYIFSGYQAIHFFELIKKSDKKYDTVVIVNPNHTGYGTEIALDDSEKWETPLGEIEVDMEFNGELNFPVSSMAHQHEHSGEVMLPFLQTYLPYDFKIVVICMMQQVPENAKKIAAAVYKAQEKLKRNTLFIASSDFSHFESPESGYRKDQFVVENILKQDTQNIYKSVKEHNVSACGYGPIMSLIEYAKLKSKSPKIELLKRGHSGERYPSNEVVNYISFLSYE